MNFVILGVTLIVAAEALEPKKIERKSKETRNTNNGPLVLLISVCMIYSYHMMRPYHCRKINDTNSKRNNPCYTNVVLVEMNKYLKIIE